MVLKPKTILFRHYIIGGVVGGSTQMWKSLFFLKTSLSLAALRGSDVDKYSEDKKEDKNEN